MASTEMAVFIEADQVAMRAALTDAAQAGIGEREIDAEGGVVRQSKQALADHSDAAAGREHQRPAA